MNTASGFAIFVSPVSLHPMAVGVAPAATKTQAAGLLAAQGHAVFSVNSTMRLTSRSRAGSSG
jgi:hypothetical protein